jgi:hypothetical protein
MQMPRLVVALSVAGVATFAVVEPVMAFQCPALIHAIYAAAGTRFDTRAYDAREKAALAANLHGEGRHEDAKKIAQEGLELLGIKPPHATR